jgi:hypothetical protein
MATDQDYVTFDAPRYIIDNYILKDGKLTDFVKEQILLQSANSLGGRIFNPASFAANFGDYSLTNSTIKRLLFRLGSDVLGSDVTSDGKTFTRTLDNDLNKHFYRSRDKFVDDFRKDNSYLKKAALGALNSLGQAIGITVKPSRSIMAQALAYTLSQQELNEYRQPKRADRLDINLDSPSEAKYTSPNARNSLTYIYGNRIILDRPFKYLELLEKAKDGELAPNFKVKKTDFEIEKGVLDQIKDKVGKKFKQFVNGFVKETVNRIRKNPVSSLVQGSSALGSNNDPFYYSEGNDTEFHYRKSEFAMALINKYWSHYYLRPMSPDGSITINNPTNNLNTDRESTYTDINNWIKEYVYQEWKTDGVFNIDSANNVTGDRADSTVMAIDRIGLDKRKTDTNTFTRKHTNLLNDTMHSPYKIHTALNVKGILKTKRETKRFQDAYTFAESRDINASDHILGSDIFDSYESAETYAFSDNNKGSIFMIFQDMRTKKAILFRPTFDSLADDFSVSYDPVSYLGRTEEFPAYAKTSRTFSLTFNIYCQTPKEYLLNQKKLDFLKSLCYPLMKDKWKIVQNPLMRFRVGDIYKDVYGFLQNVGQSTINTESTWELEQGFAGPKVISCNMSITVLHETMPYVNDKNVFERGVDDFTMTGIQYERLLAPSDEGFVFDESQSLIDELDFDSPLIGSVPNIDLTNSGIDLNPFGFATGVTTPIEPPKFGIPNTLSNPLPNAGQGIQDKLNKLNDADFDIIPPFISGEF